jgi:hypothetical protein
VKDLAHCIEISAQHLGLIDFILDEISQEYHQMRERLRTIPVYEDMAHQLYFGQKQRQMILGDLLLYILTGRGYWTATQSDEGFKSFIRVIMYIVNLLLIQESVLSAQTIERNAFLDRLEAANLEHFFASEGEQDLYTRLRAHDGRITVREPRDLYKVMDSLLPRTPGAAHELLAYIYLLNRRIGYVVPLLVIQRLFRGKECLAPPDFLLIRSGGDLFGVEVGSGMGQFSLTQGKIDQVNLFSQDTSIPVLTATIPHVYRCGTCERWITFCDQVVSAVADGETSQEYISCPSCPRFQGGACPDIIYYGQTEARGSPLRHHYAHYRDNEYVRTRSLRSADLVGRKLIQYLPVVKGLERLTSYP